MMLELGKRIDFIKICDSSTCKLNDINPYVWLQDVLCRIPITPDKYMEPLLRHNWQPKIPTQVIAKKSLAEH